MAWPYKLYDGATRPDAISGLDRRFSEALIRLFNSAPPEVQRELALQSAYRSIERQQELWDKSDKTGKWVAPPGKSKHNFGTAADLYGFGLSGNNSVSQGTKDWVKANAGAQGLYFPMGHEPWHIQLNDPRLNPGAPGSPGGVSGETADLADQGVSLGDTLSVAATPDPWSKALSGFASAAATGLGKTPGPSMEGAPGDQQEPYTELETPRAVPPSDYLVTPGGIPQAGVSAQPGLADLFQVGAIGGADQRSPYLPPKKKWV